MWATARPGPPAIAGLVTLLVALRQLVGRNPIGLSDNGDYGRVLSVVGLLRPPQTALNGYLSLHFVYGKMPSEGYGSSLNPMLRLVTAVPRAFGADSFDIRWLAAVYAVLLSVLVWFVVRGLATRRVQIVGGVLLVVVLTDTAFLSYLGSFFSEPGSILFLLLVVGVLVRIHGRTASPVLLVALVSGGLLLATVKTQNVLVGPVLACGLLFLRPRRLALPAAALLLVVPFVYVSSQPAELKPVNLYNAVFFTLLPHGNDPAKDLRALGMDPALARYSGTSAFQDPRRLHEPSFRAFVDGGGQRKLILFYATHPDRAVGLATRGTRAAAEARPRYLGNRAHLPGIPPRQLSCDQCLYSGPSRLLRPLAPVLLPALYLGALLLAFPRRRHRRDGPTARCALQFLVVGGIAQFATALLGEGDYETVKHLLFFDVTTGLVMVFCAVVLTERWSRHGARDDASAEPAETAAVRSRAQL